jgi:hypothetical protein
VLTVAPAPSDSVAQSSPAQPAADNAEVQGVNATAEPNEDDGAAAPDEVSPTVSSSATPAPQEQAAVEMDANATDVVRPSVYVNLRDGPSSSSRVIGVIAKGAKLPVLDRKRGWVQVSDPATSKEGWIYSGYVGGGHHARPRKKTAAASDHKSESSSFWDWLTK